MILEMGYHGRMGKYGVTCLSIYDMYLRTFSSFYSHRVTSLAYLINCPHFEHVGTPHRLHFQ